MDTTIGSGAAPARGATWRARMVVAWDPGASDVAPWAMELGAAWVTIRRGEPGLVPAELLVQHRSVSRQPHVRVRFDSSLGVAVVEDLGRAPGTRLNGAPLEGRVEVAPPGSVVRVGDVLVLISAWSEHPLEAVAPEALSPDLSYAHYLAERTLARAAVADVTLHVLLLGPTGAGKERLAAHYHAASGRSGPLVAVNCAGIPGELFASEVFGHARGAFSGAKAARTGLWASAHGGTLFLDEVGELPEAQQSAVLRALDSGHIRPVGADRDVATDVRIIAATSRDVEQLEADGSLRPDLVGRLAGLRVVLPGLAERREEILPLFQQALPAGAAPLASDAAERLLLHAWSKNVRELLNAARVAGLFATEVDEIGVALLPETLRAATGGRGGEGSERRPDRSELDALLQQHEGNVEQVARALGVGRATVHRWMSRLALSAQSYRRR